MIRKEEVFKIGIINKPHGVKGEVSFTFTDDIFDRVDCDYLILLLDGILVPFFIEEYRFRSDNAALVKFEGIDTAEKARSFTNVEVYFPKKYMEEQDEITSWNFFVGFKVHDVHHGDLGGTSGPCATGRIFSRVGSGSHCRTFNCSSIRHEQTRRKRLRTTERVCRQDW